MHLLPARRAPDLALRAEIEAAKAVRCQIHGNRFNNLAPMIYVAPQYRQPTHLHPERWKWRSPQYIKAIDASFSPDRWPAQETVDQDGGVRFMLKDGTVIHGISPPPVVCDLDTGEPCGRLARAGKILPLSQPTAEEILRNAVPDATPAQTAKAEVPPREKEKGYEIFALTLTAPAEFRRTFQVRNLRRNINKTAPSPALQNWSAFLCHNPDIPTFDDDEGQVVLFIDLHPQPVLVNLFVHDSVLESCGADLSLALNWPSGDPNPKMSGLHWYCVSG